MKTFCPNCEKETDCTFVCEVYECGDCGEDYGSYEKPVSTYWKTQAESAVIETLESRVEFLKGKLQDVVNWSNAYPLDIFPEPDFKKVRAALEAAGISLDQVSASIMRHVVTGVGDIARAALSGFEQSDREREEEK